MTNSWNRTQIAVNFQAFCLKSHNLCCWYYAFAHILCNACDRGCGHCNNVCWEFHPLTQNASSKAYQVVKHVMILVSTSVSVSNSEAFSVNPYRAEISTALFVGGACYQQLVTVLFTIMTCLCGDSNVHPWYLERLVYTIVEAIWLIREHWKQNQNLWSDWSIRIWKRSCQQSSWIARKAQNMGIWWVCPNAACWPWPTYTNK